MYYIIFGMINGSFSKLSSKVYIIYNLYVMLILNFIIIKYIYILIVFTIKLSFVYVE